MQKLLFAFAAACGCLGAAAQPGTFSNPVIPGDLPDPSVIRVGETYYACGTSSEWAPFYPLFTSRDLVNWTQAGHLFEEQPEWTRSSFWAPELFHRDGRTYAYYTARRKSDGTSYIGVATADRPEGPYTDHGPVVALGTEAIDAFVLEDDGKLYISWKAYGLDRRPIELLACRLSDDGLRLEGEPFSLLRDDARRGLEGQHWMKLGDYYYLIYAVNGCCGPGSDYAVSVARSKNLRGPYEKYAGNPILHGGEGVQSCGHGTVVTTPDGRMFFLCHAYLSGENFFLGRQPILSRIELGEDGWLHFEGGETALLRRPLPLPGTAQEPVKDFADDFSSPRIRPEWSWNYPYAVPDVEQADGRLCLSGRAKEGVHTGVAFCLRALTTDYTLETACLARPAGWSGLTLYGDDRNLLVWGLQDGRLAVRLVRDGREELLGGPLAVPADFPVYLRMEVRGGGPAAFAYSLDGSSWQQAGTRPVEPGELLQWDRVARPGLYYEGPETSFAEFEYVRMNRVR